MASPTTQQQIRNAPYSSASFEAWHSRHKKAPFSPTWNPLLAEWMKDDFETAEARSLAWIILRAAGHFSDWPLDEFGNELGRSDCARETGLSRQRVTEAFQALRARGYVDFEDRRIILRVDPSSPRNDLSGESGQHKQSSGQFLSFKAQYLAENPQAAKALEEARATVQALHLQILKAYKDRIPRTVCPDSPDKVVRTPRTSCPDSPDKNGRILRTVEVPENTDIEATAAAAAGAATTALTVIESEPGSRVQQQQPSRSQFMLGGPDPNEWEPVQDLLQSMEPTASEVRVEALISDCRSARPGLTPAILVDLISRWPLSPSVQSPVAILRKDLPSLLVNTKRLQVFLNGPPVRFGPPSRTDERQRENDEIAAQLRARRGI